MEFWVAMQGFVAKIVNMMKSERLFEPQGGPIIMSQIENEYGPVEWEIGAPGKAYTKWFTQMAVGLKTGVPWIMCKQEDAPDPMMPRRRRTVNTSVDAARVSDSIAH